jgi:hypothetical protein
MKELLTRHGIFSVLADRLLEMGETGLATFFRQVAERNDNVFNPESKILNRGHAAQMMDYIAEGKWHHAASQFAALEMIAQGIDPEQVEVFNEDALLTYGDILQDGVIELDDHPRVIIPPNRDDAWVSGWFILGDEARRHARRRRTNANPYDREYYEDEEEPEPDFTWDMLEREQQQRILGSLTGADEESIRIEGGMVTGKPLGYHWVGMRKNFGPLEPILERAVRLGHIREG